MAHLKKKTKTFVTNLYLMARQLHWL